MSKTRISFPHSRDESARSFLSRVVSALKVRWSLLCGKYSSMSDFGRLAARLAWMTAPPHYGGRILANVARSGFFIAPSAIIWHSNLLFGQGVFIGDRVIIYQNNYHGIEGGEIEIGDRVSIFRDTVLETGQGGIIRIGERTYIHPRCQINAYKSPITIGKRVDIAANCAFYSYDHGMKAGKWMREQPLTSKGPIIIEDEAWLGFGVIVLSGVRIGKGSVIGAGSIVTSDIPANAIACGSPAKRIRDRN